MLIFLDTTFPASVRPVIILKKLTGAVLQTYNMPIHDEVSNYFESLSDLLQVCVFPSDTVLDTTLDGKDIKRVRSPPK